MNDLVSVIVPVYNVEKYLRKCIDSILGQTYENIEIILVDDGSLDNCPAICDEYAEKDKRITVIHKENGGLSSARNVGIDIANGKFISFVDSDDYVAKDMIETAYNAIIDQNADLCIFGIGWIYEDGNAYDKVPSSPICNEVLTKEDVFKKLVLNNSFYYVPACNKLYKKTIFDSIKFPEGRIHEDEFTVHYIFDACQKVVSIEKELYFYVQRDNSIMHTPFSLKKLDCVEAFIDRAVFFANKHLNTYAEYYALRAYGLLVHYIKISDLFKYRKQFKPLLTQTLNLLGMNPRKIKLIIIYYAKCIKGALKYVLCENYLRVKLKRGNTGEIVMLATPQHGNLGDQAIVSAEYKVLKTVFPSKRIIEVPNEYYIRFPELCRKYISNKDLIVVDGGGNLGSLWKNEDDKITNIIKDFKENQIVIFPQTCFYEKDDIKRIERNRTVYKQAKRLSVMLRDKKSYDLFRSLFPGISSYYVPDIVLALKPQLKLNERRGVLLCFRDDIEKSVVDEEKLKVEQAIMDCGLRFSYTSTLVPKKVSKNNRKHELEKKWAEFASAQLVITDRLHAMIFSAITKTPCIAFDNVSKKVSGVYEWLHDANYIKCIQSELFCIDLVKEMLSVKPVFDTVTFMKNFKPLEEIIKSYDN